MPIVAAAGGAVITAVANNLVQIAIQRLNEFALREPLLTDVRTAVEEVVGELEAVQSSIQRVDNSSQSRGGILPVLRRLREVKYDIEDVLEKYTAHFGQPHGGGFVGCLHNTARDIQNLCTKRQIVTEIQEIKTRVRDIMNQQNVHAEGGSTSARDTSEDPHVTSILNEEHELEGIDGPRQQLIDMLFDEETNRKVISVVGMAGLGKTTLVRKVYDNVLVMGWFPWHAWITITKSSTTLELLRSIINQVHDEMLMPPLKRIYRMEYIQLVETLKEYLSRGRYIVVLDDLGDMQTWEHLSRALPGNDFGSRILITTQNRNVGQSCLRPCGSIYDLKLLDPNHAWSLFCKKAFHDHVCPPDLQNVSRDFVTACGGLPFAIVSIAGLLSKRDVLEWGPLYDNLRPQLNTNPTPETNDLCPQLNTNPTLETMCSILLLSYNKLPDHLKQCFMYFSIFPRHYPVKRITLIRLWIAEGFIRDEGGTTMERIAERYLTELIDRSLVQVAESYDHGRVRSCRVHNLMYDILLSKSNEENFSTSIVEQDDRNRSRIRRLSIHNIHQVVLRNVDLSTVRALFVFEENPTTIPYISNHIHGFKILKVLDLEDAPIDIFPIDFGNLPRLRYLSFRNTKLRTLSKSLGKLENLQTLDLKGTNVSELPETILNLQHLRHLLSYCYYNESEPDYHYADGMKLPQGIGTLRELQKLTYLEANKNIVTVGELGKLSQLERLGILKLRKDDGSNLCDSIARLSSLKSLSVTSIARDENLDLSSLGSPPACLQRLYLRGTLNTLPSWMNSLHRLVRMRLRWSGLKADSIRILQALPILIELALIHAYDDDSLYFGGGFPRLEILNLEGLANLKDVKVEGAMPNLKKMLIKSCGQLQKISSGTENLKNLQELHIIDMPENIVEGLLKDEEIDRLKISQIPIVRIYYSEHNF